MEKKGPKDRGDKKSFKVSYDPYQECPVLEIIDTEGMSEFLLKHPEAGTYRIRKTRNGLQMTK